MLPCWMLPRRWQSPRRRLECSAQLRALGVRALVLDQGWRRICVQLPLAGANRNPGGTMFGGAVAALADPIPAMVCNQVFPGHAVWTRAMSLDFRREGHTALELRFMLAAEQETAIRDELRRRGRSTPAFEYGFWDAADRLCVQVKNTVAIRPAGYVPPTR